MRQHIKNPDLGQQSTDSRHRDLYSVTPEQNGEVQSGGAEKQEPSKEQLQLQVKNLEEDRSILQRKLDRNATYTKDLELKYDDVFRQFSTLKGLGSEKDDVIIKLEKEKAALFQHMEKLAGELQLAKDKLSSVQQSLANIGDLDLGQGNNNESQVSGKSDRVPSVSGNRPKRAMDLLQGVNRKKSFSYYAPPSAKKKTNDISSDAVLNHNNVDDEGLNNVDGVDRNTGAEQVPAVVEPWHDEDVENGGEEDHIEERTPTIASVKKDGPKRTTATAARAVVEPRHDEDVENGGEEDHVEERTPTIASVKKDEPKRTRATAARDQNLETGRPKRKAAAAKNVFGNADEDAAEQNPPKKKMKRGNNAEKQNAMPNNRPNNMAAKEKNAKQPHIEKKESVPEDYNKFTIPKLKQVLGLHGFDAEVKALKRPAKKEILGLYEKLVLKK